MGHLKKFPSRKNKRPKKLPLPLKKYIDNIKANKAAEKAALKLVASGEATSTSAWSQDDSSSAQGFDCGPSTSGGIIERVDVKVEGIKEELMLEDYGDPSQLMEFQSFGESESTGIAEDIKMVQIPSSTEGPFETVICGTSDVKIKQEVFEDESDVFGDAEPFSSETAQSALPTNVSPIPFETVHVKPPPKKCSSPKKRAATSTVFRSQKILKGLPALSLQKCQICLEVFSSPSDLVEHCILKHSDACKKFSQDNPPMEEHFKSAESLQGFNSPERAEALTEGFGANTATEYNDSTPPGHRVTNPPGQPPKHWIPPYISACDVFDGVFVSLRSIPVEYRKATRDKIVELVSLLAKEKVDPVTVSLIIYKKELVKSGPELGRYAQEPARSAQEPGMSGPKPARSVPEPATFVQEPAKTVPKPAKSVPESARSAQEPARSVPQPARSAQKPEPARSAPKPKPARSAQEQEPARSAPEPELARSAPEPKPARSAPEPEPARSAPEPKPARSAQEPEPARSALEPKPARSAQEPEPARSAPEPEPARSAQEPEPARSAPDPARSAPESKPSRSVPEPARSAPEPEGKK